MVKSSKFVLFGILDMSEIDKQLICIKYCSKLSKNAMEAYEMIQTAFRDDSLSRSKTFGWFKCFKDG